MTHVLGGAGAGDLVLREAAQDDSSSLVDCLGRVSYVKDSALVVYYYLYLHLSFSLGATLGEISQRTASHSCSGA